MSQVIIMALISLTAGAVVLAVGYRSRANRIKRALRSVETIAIENIQEGHAAKVSGRVRCLDDLLSAPLTGRRCVYFWVSVDELRSVGGNADWVRVINEYDGVDFLVEDDTGIARVNVDRAQPLLVVDRHFRSGTPRQAVERLEAYLEGIGERMVDETGRDRHFRYQEGVLELGELVSVLGDTALELNPDPSHPVSGYRSRPRRPVLRSPEDGALFLTQDPSVLEKEGLSFTVGDRTAFKPLHCPHCGARKGFRSTADEHECLSCRRAF